eukprot:gene7153-16847_t
MERRQKAGKQPHLGTYLKMLQQRVQEQNAEGNPDLVFQQRVETEVSKARGERGQ